MADRAVGHHTFEVGLVDGGKTAHHKRGHAKQPSDIMPGRSQTRKRTKGETGEYRKRRNLRADGKERGHRGRRAFVNIGCPHMERRRRKLEGNAGKKEHQANHRTNGSHGVRLHQRVANRFIARPGAETIEQRGAEQEQARRQGA